MTGLWLPEELGEILCVTIDPKQSGATEWDGMALVNTLGFDWLDGKLDTGTYFDALSSVGIDPINFVGVAEDYVEYLGQHRDIFL